MVAQFKYKKQTDTKCIGGKQVESLHKERERVEKRAGGKQRTERTNVSVKMGWSGGDGIYREQNATG